jgi:hypothetical protein
MPPPPNSLLTLHMPAGIVLQAIAKPKSSRRTATWYSMTHHHKSQVFQLSTVQWHRSLHHFRRRLEFTGEMLGLWAAAGPWNPSPLNSRLTVRVLAGQFVALQNLRVIVSLDVWRVS